MRYKIKKSLSIIVPCKNEAGNIMSIYNSINISDRKVEILFGDDKSIDSTKEKIFQLIKLNKKKNITIEYYKGPGINKASNVKKGFNLAKNEIFIIHDADNTVNGREIRSIIKSLDLGKNDFINCSRMIKKQKKNAMNKPNYWGNKFFSIIYTFILSQKITDTLCGSKAFLKKDWPKIKKLWDTWGPKDHWGDFNLLLSAKYLNLRIYEYPVIYFDRVYGQTKMTNLILQFFRMLLISFNGLFKIKFIK